MNTEERERLSRNQYHRIAEDSALRLALARADFGKSLIWEVLRNGDPVAELILPRDEPEGWVSYEIVPMEADSILAESLKSPAFWMNADLVYKNRALGLVATHAFAAGEGPRDGRIHMHGLRFSLILTLGEKLRMKWQDFTARFRK
jgi:hypothetical protein